MRRSGRVRVVRQTSALDCGPACLAMILGHHGRRTALAECRERVGLGRDGTSAATLAQAARSYGLRTRAYSAEPRHLEELPLPAIAHWGFDHFVVVEAFRDGGATIVDPAVGRRRIDARELDEKLTGVVLTFEPGPELDTTSVPAPRTWRGYLRAYLAQAPGVLAQILAASLLLQVTGLALPLAAKVLVDHVLPFRREDVLALLGWGLALTLVMQALVSHLRGRLLVLLQARIDLGLVPGFVEHLLRLPYRFFEERPTGDLLMRLASHATIRDILTGQVLSLVLDGALALGYLAVLLAGDLTLGAVALGLGLLQVAVLVVTGRTLAGLSQAEVSAQAASQSYVVEALSGIGTLKASGAEGRALDQWLGLFFKEVDAGMRRTRLTSLVDALLATLRVAGPLLLLYLGTYQVMGGQMGLGSLLAYNALAAGFLVPVASLVVNGSRLPAVSVHLERLADILETETEERLPAALPSVRPTGAIEVRNVGFRYSPSGPWVLRDVSFTVEPGQTLALVGRTGCGKTTLLKLLLGFYEPTEGEILYDGVPLRQRSLRDVRSHFGVVLQEPFLFSGSIRSNIASGDLSLPLERARWAARIAAIDDEIAAMPMAYETRLSEGAASVSGGQRQRLSLARALAHDPAILFLDEATSHLDSATEAVVEANLRTLERTRIVIAHRLSTVRHADTILVLEDGTVQERGRHEDLVARGGVYAALVLGQEPTAPRQGLADVVRA